MEFHKILVPAAGSEIDEPVTKLACWLAKKVKGKIWSVYVITVKRSLPLETEVEPEIRKAESVLDRITKIAKEESYEVETDVLQAREAGPAIIDEAVERGVDLILLGVKHKREFGQFNLGSVIPYVLKNAACPVMVYQE